MPSPGALVALVQDRHCILSEDDETGFGNDAVVLDNACVYDSNKFGFVHCFSDDAQATEADPHTANGWCDSGPSSVGNALAERLNSNKL